MKVKPIQLSILLLSLLYISCSSNNKENDNRTTEESENTSKIETEAKKDVSELTYRDVIPLVFSDEGEGIEWHGEEMPNLFKDSIAISTNGSCSEDDCGEALFITNNSSSTVETIVKASYDIEGDIGYMAWKYSIEPGATQSMGCSHLCYNGKGYEFSRQIVGSVQVEKDNLD